MHSRHSGKFISGTWTVEARESRVQGQPYILSKFKASLGYMRSRFKNAKKKIQTKQDTISKPLNKINIIKQLQYIYLYITYIWLVV